MLTHIWDPSWNGNTVSGQKEMFFMANLHEGPDPLGQVWPSEVSLK